MTDTASIERKAPIPWFKPVLLLPLAVAGLWLVVLCLIVALPPRLILTPLLFDLPELSQSVLRILVKLGWFVCVLALWIFFARRLVRRREGSKSGILSDQSLFNAMANDNSFYFWALLVILAADIAGWAVFLVLGLGRPDVMYWHPAFFGAFASLRLAGLSVERADPILWSHIRVSASDTRFRWPGPRALALLIPLALLVLLSTFGLLLP